MSVSGRDFIKMWVNSLLPITARHWLNQGWSLDYRCSAASPSSAD